MTGGRSSPERKQSLLSADRLRELLEYFPETGEWRWRIDHGFKIRAGMTAGHSDKRGYVWIGILGGLYLAHRLAVLYMTGEWPTCLVDHEDTDKGNNRWRNIRPATNQENLANRGKAKNNTSGFKNVYRHGKRWRVQVRAYGKMSWVGGFATIEEAAAAAEAARKELFGEFARG